MHLKNPRTHYSVSGEIGGGGGLDVFRSGVWIDCLVVGGMVKTIRKEGVFLESADKRRADGGGGGYRD